MVGVTAAGSRAISAYGGIISHCIGFHRSSFLVALIAASLLGLTPLSAAQTPPAGAAVEELPILSIERAGQRVTHSARLRLPSTPLPDLDGAGAVVIEGDGLVIDLDGGVLRGTADSVEPWERTGTGVVLRGRGITLRNGSIRGFKVGILASGCDELHLHDLDVSGNWGERLSSSSAAEDAGDWLWPHRNDSHEWRTRYGAAICVERSDRCRIERVRAVGMGAQNGIVLDRVNDSIVADCECSFLSGWGLALWRSSRNTIARNRFDFCVRGYSHGVYNRGQDSAGILLFEQCSDNVIALNSATHSGDGIFIFAGLEALGPELPEEAEATDPAMTFSLGRGCNRNLIIGNDFSDAVAHGIEVTFSFDTIIVLNTLRRCGITGIWGGYSQGTRIMANVFESNGSTTNSGEEAAISIEHGSRLLIAQNQFRSQGVAIKLWWDDDRELLRKAWARANGAECRESVVVDNTFVDCGIGLQSRECTSIFVAGNRTERVAVEVDALPPIDRVEAAQIEAVKTLREEAKGSSAMLLALRDRLDRMPGRSEAIGSRAFLAGREHIVMTERGPYDWTEPLLIFDRSEGGTDLWRLLGQEPFRSATIRGPGGARLGGGSGGQPIVVYSPFPNRFTSYELRVHVGEQPQPIAVRGALFNAEWEATFFAWTVDPREDLEGWRQEATHGVRVPLKSLELRYGHRGPSDLDGPEDLKGARLPADFFGMIATTEAELPAGRYRVRTLSDDGVRLRIDGNTVIERWDWHGPTVDTAEFDIAEERRVRFDLEHFELDGYAVLVFSIEQIDGEPTYRPGRLPFSDRATRPAPQGPSAPRVVPLGRRGAEQANDPPPSPDAKPTPAAPGATPE
ncbi:MAG: right-handed parallel beta-helix repeat-containing protein [Phycisphaeraceae bacterium]|nr:right-handed parallel beta-helix repeat-containing protein [Phycisphaeraceae bacterium]